MRDTGVRYCQVNDSIGWITSHLGIDPMRTYTGGCLIANPWLLDETS